mmetsp:Transcript_49612/g.124744  ORF Transcript_49612/g.124744 Transcript_49612/m.124744 type:complete len:86 (-) Transcript_49612:61-318(-)
MIIQLIILFTALVLGAVGIFLFKVIAPPPQTYSSRTESQSKLSTQPSWVNERAAREQAFKARKQKMLEESRRRYLEKRSSAQQTK